MSPASQLGLVDSNYEHLRLTVMRGAHTPSDHGTQFCSYSRCWEICQWFHWERFGPGMSIQTDSSARNEVRNAIDGSDASVHMSFLNCRTWQCCKTLILVIKKSQWHIVSTITNKQRDKLPGLRCSATCWNLYIVEFMPTNNGDWRPSHFVKMKYVLKLEKEKFIITVVFFWEICKITIIVFISHHFMYLHVI